MKGDETSAEMAAVVVDGGGGWVRVGALTHNTTPPTTWAWGI